MSKQIIWRIYVLGCELFGFYWNCQMPDDQRIFCSITLLHVLSFGVCQDRNMFYLNTVAKLWPR
jgi:hypothetical protein